MSSPAWKTLLTNSLKENIEKSGLSATYASISTVRHDSTPAVRTVVMRGFTGEHHSENIGWHSDLLVVITDKRSNKVKEIENNPNTEINWFMNGTMEQFRIRGTITIVDKNYNQTRLDHLNNHIEKAVPSPKEHDDHKSLALQMFLKHQKQTKEGFNWQAERLRHFYQFGPKMRKEMTVSNNQELEIDKINPDNGWFKSNNNQVQELLEEAFDNFVLLVIKVTSVHHWSPTTGTKSML